MLKPLYEYSLPYKCMITIGTSLLFVVVGFGLNWILGKPLLLDSAPSLINALIFPVTLLGMAGGGEPDVHMRREQFALVSFIFCIYLLSLAGVIYLFGFPASRTLAIMPITTTLFVLPWAIWSYRSAMSLRQSDTQ